MSGFALLDISIQYNRERIPFRTCSQNESVQSEHSLFQYTMNLSIYYFQRFSLGEKLLFILWVQEKTVNLKYNPALNQLIPRPLLSPPTSSVTTTDGDDFVFVLCSYTVLARAVRLQQGPPQSTAADQSSSILYSTATLQEGGCGFTQRNNIFSRFYHKSK